MKNSILIKFFLRLTIILLIVIAFWLTIVYFIIEKHSADEIASMVEANQYEYAKSMSNIKGDKAHQEAIKHIFQTTEELFAIEILKKDKSILFKGIKDIPKNLENRFNNYLIKSDTFSYEMIKLEDSNLVMIFSQKIYSNGFEGYLKAIVKLDKYVFNNLIRSRYYIFAIVVMTIIFVTITIFPLIFKQYKKLNLEKYRLLKSNMAIILALGEAIAKRDSDTDEHNYRVTIYSIKLAEELNLSARKMRALIKGAFLHDVGKIGIRDDILLKPGKLSTEEFVIMREHVKLGLEIIEDINWLKGAKRIVGYHHEKVDGSGYPYGLRGEKIPIEARIFAVVDVFDALTSKRPYKEPFNIDKSLEIINKEVDRHFDKDVVEKFNKIAKKLYEEIKNKDKKELKEYLQESAKAYFDI